MIDSEIAFVFVIPAIVFWMLAVPIAVLVQRRPRPRAYCVKERAEREITSAHTVILRNGRKALQGKCSSCGTTLFRMKSNQNLVVVIAREWGTMLSARFGRIVHRPHPRAYCVKERAEREITSAHTVILRNGRKALQGKCSSCGTIIFRIK